MSVKIKITYDAGKLSKKLPKIIQKHMGRYARSSATGAKQNIDRGVKPPLKDSTIETRKRKKITGTKPLYETGYLHRSIEGKSDGTFTMAKYGIYHHKGDGVPRRKFISPSKKVILKSFDAFRKNIRKAFKKWL